MPLAPLRIRSLRRLLLAYGVNQLGDWSGELALAVVVFAATRSAAAVAATWVAHRAVLALAAPLLVARIESRGGLRVLPLVYLVQAVLFAALAAVAPWGLVAILPLVAADGLLAPCARALARAAFVAAARPAGLLRDANALVNVVFTANGVLAPVLGGLLVAFVGPRSALAANAASFLLAAAAVRGVCLAGATGSAASGSSQLREAMRHVRSRAILVRLLTGDAVVLLFIAAISPIEVAFITGTLGQSNATLGVVLAVWGAGMIAGGAAVARVRELSTPLLLATSTLALAVSCLGVGASSSIGWVLGWSVVGGLGNGAYGMAFLTVVQERTADAFQARVSALYETIASVAPGLGFVLGGVVAATISPRAVYLLAGAGALGALVWTAAALRGADWSLPEPRLASRPEPA